MKKTLAITDGNDSDGSMPSLETVSDSSDNDEDDDDEDDLWESGSEQEYQEEDDDDDESGYDTDEEEELKAMLRDAMESAARTDSEYLNPGKEFDISQLEQEKKGNPFIKLLGSLRGKSSRILHNVEDPNRLSTIRSIVFFEPQFTDQGVRCASGDEVHAASETGGRCQSA